MQTYSGAVKIAVVLSKESPTLSVTMGNTTVISEGLYILFSSLRAVKTTGHPL